jgi:hypothetical protein
MEDIVCCEVTHKEREREREKEREKEINESEHHTCAKA